MSIAPHPKVPLLQLGTRRPRLVLALAFLVTMAAAPGILQLKLRTDGHALVSEDDPAVVEDNAIRREFGIEDNFVVLVHTAHTNGIYNSNTLQLVRDLTAAIKATPGINASNVASLATEPTFRFRPGTLHFQPLLDMPTQTREQTDQLREDIRKIQLYTGTIVAFDGRSTAILVGAPAGTDRPALYRALTERLDACGQRGDEVFVIGAPVAESLLGLHILEDLGLPRALLPASVPDTPVCNVWPRNVCEFRAWIARHIGLLPAALGVMALVFYSSFRRMTASLLPLMEVAACLVFVFGVMGWLGVPVYLTTAVMPVILTATGISEEIYIFKRYIELLGNMPGQPHSEAVDRAMQELWRPIVKMAATTIIGFLSFGLSSVRPVQMFGLFTALGIVFCLVWSLFAVPAMLVVLKPACLLPKGRQATTAPAQNGGQWSRFAGWVIRRRTLVLTGTAVLALLTPLGIQRVAVQDSWLDGFDPTGEFRRATRLLNEQFHGAHLLQVRVDGGHAHLRARAPWVPGDDSSFPLPKEFDIPLEKLVNGWLVLTGNPRTNVELFQSPAPAAVWRSWVQSATNRDGRLWVATSRDEGSPHYWLQLTNGEPVQIEFFPFAQLRPDTMRRLAALKQFITAQRTNAVGGVLSAADYLATTRFMMHCTDTNAHCIPDNPQQIKSLWDHYRMARGPERLHQAVDTNFSTSLLTVFLKDANFVGTARLMADLRAYEQEHLTPHGFKLSFAGDVAVSQSLIQRIVSTQVKSLGSSLLGIFLVVVLALGRSLRGGICCLLPSLLAVAANFAVMGWTGMPLGVATSMFAGMTLGMGVDFAIHLLERFQRALTSGMQRELAILEAINGVGPAMVLNALGIALGFGVLMLSQVPANARLGALVVLGVVNCFVATLVVLPALLSRWPGGKALKL